jgi:tRNA threonylcarbamoyladenosine biosynthesis protein TsaE
MTPAPLTIICPDVTDTEALGARLAGALESGDLLSLQGPLGAGKTSLVRGMAAGLGVDPTEVRSPTFVLHHIYATDRLRLHHIDLYRLGADAAIELLDIDGLLETGAVVAEWGELAALDRWRPVRIAAAIDRRQGRAFALLSTDAPERIRAAWGDSI